jgi:hypothetical protein
MHFSSGTVRYGPPAEHVFLALALHVGGVVVELECEREQRHIPVLSFRFSIS